MLRSGGSPPARMVALALVLFAAAGTLGCSSAEDDGAGARVSRSEFVLAMEDRYGVSGDQATCIADYVFDDYDASEIAVLAEEGMPELPQARWEPYLNATVACITHDEPLDGAP